MPILDQLPEPLQPLLPGLRTETAAPASPEDSEKKQAPRYLIFETDIAGSQFGPEWLVVSDGRVRVFESGNGHGPVLRTDLPVEGIKEAKAEIFVGNGVVEARTSDEVVSLIRYSHGSAPEASIVARHINALANGQEPKWEQLEHKTRYCPKCKRVLPEDSDVCRGCLDKRAVLIRLFRFLKPFKLQATGSVLIIFAIAMLELVPPWIFGRVVDVINNGVKYNQPSAAPVLRLVLLFAATRVGFAFLQYGQRRINAWLGARILMEIRIAMFDKLSTLSLAYYDKRNHNSVMSRVTNDADHLWDFLTDGIPWFASTLLAIVGTGAVLFRMNAMLAGILLSPGILVFLLNRWFHPRARRRWHHVWHRISKMYASLGTALSGMRVVKAFAQEDRERVRFRERNRQVFEASYAANALWAGYWPILGLTMASGSFILWLVGGGMVLNHVPGMTLGVLTAFSGYLMRFYTPFQDFSRVLDWSTRSLTAADRVFEILDTEPDIRDADDAVAIPDMKGDIEFKDVSFTYDGARRVLEDFTLKVEAGEMIGLVGHSGAGKTTIINLLTRFYDVSDGSISIDGVDIRNIRSDDFRRQIGVVLQEPFLFPGTIRDNIAYARPDASVEDVMKAAKAANCHEFVMKFPDGYDTQVGERGQRLSGGERQRISIARAILHNPRILILDEATASVDTETEQQIQQAIQRLVQSRTTFAIAHRLSTLRNATRLVVMKEGKMAECGSHDELMEIDGGEYAKLVNIQNEVNKIRAI